MGWQRPCLPQTSSRNYACSHKRWIRFPRLFVLMIRALRMSWPAAAASQFFVWHLRIWETELGRSVIMVDRLFWHTLVRWTAEFSSRPAFAGQWRRSSNGRDSERRSGPVARSCCLPRCWVRFVSALSMFPPIFAIPLRRIAFCQWSMGYIALFYTSPGTATQKTISCFQLKQAWRIERQASGEHQHGSNKLEKKQ